MRYLINIKTLLVMLKLILDRYDLSSYNRPVLQEKLSVFLLAYRPSHATLMLLPVINNQFDRSVYDRTNP